MKRYRTFREHKFIRHYLFDVSRFFAQCDWDSEQDSKDLLSKLKAIQALLEAHSAHEETAISNLLARAVPTFSQHKSLDSHIRNLCVAVSKSADSDEFHNAYLDFNRFLSTTLNHLHEEETAVMKLLHQNCDDEEIRSIGANSYEEMTPEDMVHMFDHLRPHFNRDDRHVFLYDMATTQPRKFTEGWSRIAESLDSRDRCYVESELKIRSVSKTKAQKKVPATPWEEAAEIERKG